MTPCVSIIVPVYNVEKYVAYCVESVLAQTYKDFELIIINDGSTDKSREIVEEYAQIHNNIHVINQKNMGLSGARNTGIHKANGKYLTFIDSDDWVSNDYLEVLVTNAQLYDADIVSVSDCWVDQNGRMAEHKHNFQVFTKNAADALYGMFDSNYAWGKLYKSCLFSDIEFPQGRRYEDIGTLYKLYNLSNIVTLAEAGKYYYRYRSDSITSSRKESDVIDKIHYIGEMNKNKGDKKYNYWDLYMLNKMFGAIADLYKIKDIENWKKKQYIKQIYHLARDLKIKIVWLKSNGNILKAVTVKLQVAHLLLHLKYVGFNLEKLCLFIFC